MIRNRQIFIFFLLGLIVFSCIKHSYSKKEFYSSNKIKSIKYFYTKDDLNPYSIINYLESGEVKDSLFFDIEGKLHGTCYYNEKNEGYLKWTNYTKGRKDGFLRVEYNDGRKTIENFENDLLHGIVVNYDRLGKPISEYLYINDTVVARKLYKLYLPSDTAFGIMNNSQRDTVLSLVKDTITLIEYSIHFKDNYKTIGSLHLKNDKVDSLSNFNSYTYLYMPDTISLGNVLNVNFHAFLSFNKEAKDSTYLVVKLGKMNSDFTFKDSIREIRTKKGVMDFDIEINKYQKGYNLLTGKVQYMLDDMVIGTSLLFEDFVVVD
jgi:hypothetical protein